MTAPPNGGRPTVGPEHDDATVPDGRPVTRKDRIISKLVTFVARLLYREIEVHWEPAPPGRPRITVANHFGGVADALVLLAVMPTRPGVVARDVIWKTPLVGRFMDWIGAIPVHKADDGGGGSANDAMFASCYQALADGEQILIFPEGVTRNEPSIAEVKTGAARIALGARSSGVDDVVIVPVGIHYENKAKLRSRVFVNGGEPIDPAIAVPGADVGRGADDRDAVGALTAAIDVGLRRAAPDYADWSEAHLLTAGAEVALRSQLDDPEAAVPIGLRDRLATTLSDRPAEHRARICDAVAAYRRDLDDLGLTDAQLAGHRTPGRFATTVLAQLAIGLLLAPFAIAGAAINALAFLAVKAVGRMRVAPSVTATIKPLTAIAAYGATWGVVIWWASSTWGWSGGVTAAVLMPVYLAAAIVFVERVVSLWSLLTRQRRRRASRGIGDQLAVERHQVVEAVLAA